MKRRRFILPSKIRGGVAVIPWYLSGGISASNCIASYSPKGAASLLASYTNLANPGTNDAAPGVAPAWDSVNGWDFSANRHLTCGLTPSPNWSVLCKFSGLVTGTKTIFGSYVGEGQAFLIQPLRSSDRGYYHDGGFTTAGTIQAGVMGFSDRTAYLNGVSDGSIPTGSMSNLPIFIGALNAGAPTQSCNYMQAFSIYNTPLTANQMLSVTNAMNLL